MSEPVKIAIVLEGGLLSAVLSAGVAVEYVTIDYDIDGADEDELSLIPQDGGEPCEAFLREPGPAEINGEFVLAAHEGFPELNTVLRGDDQRADAIYWAERYVADPEKVNPPDPKQMRAILDALREAREDGEPDAPPAPDAPAAPKTTPEDFLDRMEEEFGEAFDNDEPMGGADTVDSVCSLMPYLREARRNTFRVEAVAALKKAAAALSLADENCGGDSVYSSALNDVRDVLCVHADGLPER